MAGKLRFTDLVTFSYLDHNWGKVKDDFGGGMTPQVMGQPANQGLNVQIAATHSGIITRNNGFYLPERMRKGASTFTKDYPKPVLLHHEDHKDPVGRVVDSVYIDTSGVIQDKYRGTEVKNSRGKIVGVINDSLIKDFVGDKMPFGQQVDVVRSILRDSVLEDPDYSGLGFIKILANISDPNAIQKFLDGRYITGSIGASTDKAVCSICKTDWTKGGPCDHTPGGVYDEAKCFIIAGNLEYEEYSLVNTPADRHSKVLQLDYNGNKTEIETISDYKGRIYEVQLQFPQYDSDNKEEKGMAMKDAKASDAEGNLEIKDVTTDPAPDTDPGTEGVQDVADSATQVAEGEEEGVENAGQISDEAKNDDESAGEGKVEDKKAEDKVVTLEDLISRALDIEDALSDEDQEKLYDALWDEVQACFKDGEFTLEQIKAEKLEDVKLSAEQRKKLSKSQFCGPNQTFPVPDAAHVTAARKLINSYKGPGSKEVILDCINRKAKAKGCEKKECPVQDDAKSEDGTQHARIMQIILAAFEENHWSPDDDKPLEEEDKKVLTNILKRLASMVGKDSFQQALYDEKLAHEETVLLDEIVSLEEQLGDIRDRFDASQKEYHLLFKDLEEVQDSLVNANVALRKSKESRLTDLAALRDQKVEEQDYTKLSDSDLDSEINRTLEVVDMNKITDKLGDGMSRVPEGEVNDPTAILDGDQKRKFQLEDVAKYQEKYVEIRMSRGQQAAEQYVNELQRRGLLPQGLEDIEGGNE